MLPTTQHLGAHIGVDALETVLRHLSDRSIKVADVGIRRPTLDDVFLSLTGHGAESGDATRETMEAAA